MTQYTLICLIVYLLTHYVALAITPVDCNFKAADHNHRSESYKCPKRCKKSRTNPHDLRQVELNYRICSHPDLADGVFSLFLEESHAEIKLQSSRRKRALTLTPVWQSEPQSLSVNQGNKIELACSITAVSSSADYEWFYSETFPSNIGDTLSDLYNGVGDDSGTLSIQSASSKDAGFYQCKVTDNTKDGLHVIFSNIVAVQIESYYLKTPSGTMSTVVKSSFNAEDVLILECPDIDSNPPADITWYKDDVLFSDQGAFVYPFDEAQTFAYNSETYMVKKNSLVLMSLTNADNGKYKCRATNSKTGQYFDLKQYNVDIISTQDSMLQDVKPTVLKEGVVSVERGSAVKLYCLGVGHPTTMTYTWTKSDGTALIFDSRIVSSDFGRQVTISNTENSDAFLYKCSCSNNRGNTDSYINLKVEEPSVTLDITITRAPESLYVHDVYLPNPADIVIPCVATGADQVRFLKNGELLEDSNRYTFTQNVGLTFTSYSSQDSGVYQCVAFNSEYWKQKMTFVMITEKVTANAAADVTLINSEATLSCDVTGYPYPDVSWSYDKQAITNTATSHSPYILDTPTSHNLVIKNIGFTDGGVYTCTAVSRALNYQPDYSHTASSEVTLTIEQEVEMKAADTTSTATVDDTLTLGCTANAKPTPTEVTWYVDGTKVDTALAKFTRFSISTKNVNNHQAYSELVITGILITDGGTYKCEASNTVKDKTTTSSATTTVLAKYLSVTVDDAVREIAAGDGVTITCTAQGSPQPQQIRWFLGSTDGNVIDPNKHSGYKISSKTQKDGSFLSTMEIEKQMTDQDYVCEATNYLDNVAQFDEVKIIVRTYTKTQASRERSFVSTDVGVSAAMTCYCSGVPLPAEGIWKKNGVAVATTSTQAITNTPQYDPDFKLTSVLTFRNPTSADIGEYRCGCTNSYQGDTYSDATTVELRVVTQASITWSADNPRVAQYGKKVKLACTAAGLPRPTSIVWSRKLAKTNSDKFVVLQPNTDRFAMNETVVDISTLRSVLTISATEYGDDGTYNCYADNKINDVVYSRNDESALLIYQNPTVAMKTQEVATNADDSAPLSCKVSSKPAPTKLDWFYGDTKITNQPTSTHSGYDRSSEYTVNAVTSQTEGKYRCVGYHTYEGQEATGEGYTYVRLHRPFAVTSSSSPLGATTVNEHTALTLTCTATGVPAVAAFTWTIDSVLLTSDEITSKIGKVVTETNYERIDLNIEVKSTLVMESVKYTNLGKYKCATSQTWGGVTETASNEFDITVNFESKLKSGTGSTEVFQNVGSQIRVTCVVYGNPAPDDVTWKWADGTKISDGDDFKISNHQLNSYKKESTLQFTFLPIYHSKDVQCSSKNALSANEETLKFTLNMNPNTMSIIESGEVESGKTVTLTCLTTFDSGAISWYKDSQILESNNRISFATNSTYITKNSVLTIVDLDSKADAGNYTCKVTDDKTQLTTEHQITLGEPQTGNSGGLSTGIIIALSVLVVFIVIVVILIVIVFVHGRHRRKRMSQSIFDDKSVPGYENQVFADDKNLQSVISMPDTAIENLPKVVEPIVLSKNEPDHPVKEATIMQQATLTQQRNRNPNLGKAHTLDHRGMKPNSTNSRRRREPDHYTLDRRNKLDWY